VTGCACPDKGSGRHVGACLAVVPGSAVVGFLDGGGWSACFGLSYRDLCIHDAFHGQRMARSGPGELRALTGSGGIPANRNKVVRGFLDSTRGEWLLFIDTDMGFSADTLDRLITSADPVERPVMGGLCFAGVRDKAGSAASPLYAERFKIVPTVYAYVDTGDEIGFRPIPDYPRDQVMEVAGTGAACLLIHRSALETVRAKLGDVWFDPTTHPTALKGKPRTFSEDLSFCVRLASCNIPVHVNTAVKTTHEKGMAFLDEDAFDQQLAIARLDQQLQAAA
jgi:hypothetical protein